MIDGSNVLLQNGPLRAAPHPLNFIAAGVWLFVYYFYIVSMCAHFVYRYFVVCRQRTLSAREYAAMLAAGALVLLGYMAALAHSQYPPAQSALVSERVRAALREYFGESQTGVAAAADVDVVMRVSMIGVPVSRRPPVKEAVFWVLSIHPRECMGESFFG